MIVLVIDDERTWPDFYRELVKPGVSIAHAWSLEEAKDFFLEHRDLVSMIIIDGHVRAPLDASIELVHFFREEAHFYGPIVAASANFINNSKLVKAGCDHAWDSKFPERKEAFEYYPEIFAQFSPRR